MEFSHAKKSVFSLLYHMFFVILTEKPTILKLKSKQNISFQYFEMVFKDNSWLCFYKQLMCNTLQATCIFR